MAKATPKRHANEPRERLKIKFKKDDMVKVIAGRDKGKTGRILDIDREKGKLLVEGIMMVKRHTRPNPQKQIKGGIAERESAIHVSNVMILASDGKPTRISYHTEGEGATARRVRVSRRTGEPLETKSR